MGEKKDENNQDLTEIGKKYLKNDFLAAKPPVSEKEEGVQKVNWPPKVGHKTFGGKFIPSGFVHYSIFVISNSNPLSFSSSTIFLKAGEQK